MKSTSAYYGILSHLKLESIALDFKKEYKKPESKHIAQQKRANYTCNIYAGTYPLKEMSLWS